MGSYCYVIPEGLTELMTTYNSLSSQPIQTLKYNARTEDRTVLLNHMVAIVTNKQRSLIMFSQDRVKYYSQGLVAVV